VARYGRLRGWEAFPEGEVDGLVEAECPAAGVGLLELLVAEGRTCLVEAFLPAARVERIPPGSDLVHQGVAAQLYASICTVQAHLSRACAKLGVTSRTQLARALSLQG